MDSNRDEFNIPDLIVDPRTRTQYTKGKFLGKVTKENCFTEKNTKKSLRFSGRICAMLRIDRQSDESNVCRQDRSEIFVGQTAPERKSFHRTKKSRVE